MRNVESHLLEDKMDEAVTHYINSQPPEAVHVDANSLALNIQDDGESRVVTLMHSQNFQSQMCRQVSVGEQVGDGPWVEDILDAEGRIAVLMAHLAQNARATHHTHGHQKISSVRGDVAGNVILDSAYGQTLEPPPDTMSVQVPSLPSLPTLQEMKRCPETNWFEKDKTELKNDSQMLSGQAGGVLEICAGASPGHNKLHSKKSLPHKKRISKKLKRNNGGSTPQQELVVINCGEEGPHEEILPDTFATPPTHQMRPLLICQICGEFYGEEQLKFYHHLKEHYEPHTTIIIENPVSDLNIDKMTNSCIVDNVATLPDSIVELSLENTVPKTLYQDKHILYNDKSLYSNKYTISMEKEMQEADKTDIYSEDLDKLGLYTCGKCNKAFKKQKQCEAHIKEAHSNPNPKLEDMGEFSETEDLMEGIHVAVDDPDTYELPHLVVDNGHVHQEHVRAWYMRSGTPAMCECGGVGYCDACTHAHPQLLASAPHMHAETSQAPVSSHAVTSHAVTSHAVTSHAVTSHVAVTSHAVMSHGPLLTVHVPPASPVLTHAPMHTTTHAMSSNESILPHSVSHAAVSPHAVMSNAVSSHAVSSHAVSSHAVSSHSTMPSNVVSHTVSSLAPSLVTNQRSMVLKEEVLQGIFDSDVQNENGTITDSIIESEIRERTEVRVKSERTDATGAKSTNSTKSRANSNANGPNLTSNGANSTANGANLTENGANSGEKKAKKYECAYCSRVFDHRNSLLYHVHMHNGRQQVCRDCGKSFYTANALKIHKRVHSDYRPCKCEECGKEFKQWSDLKYHKASIHSNQKNYKCEFCGKEFARRYSLNIHRRIHTGERNYKCDYCAMTFRASSYRLSHMRTHTGNKPHQCPHCDKRFGVAYDLRRHLKVHDKQRLNEPKTKSKTIVKDIKCAEKADTVDGKTNNITFEDNDPNSTRLPVLKSLLDKKPSKNTKKAPKKAPNVTVQGKGQFKLDQYNNDLKQEQFLKDVYEYKDDTPKKTNYAEEKSKAHDKDFATLRPLFRNHVSEVETDRPAFNRESTDGKLQIYTQVERKEFAGPIVSNSVSLSDLRNLEREVTRDRGDLHSEAVESGFFERLTSFYNIPAV